MTYTSKFRSASGKVVALFTCPEHGTFEAEVERMENGEAPDEIDCTCEVSDDAARRHASAMMSGFWSHSKPTTVLPSMAELTEYCKACRLPATWTPSADIACKVRRIEAVRGKWEKPERKTYLDTRKLGEGQSVDEFRAERRKVWREQRLGKALQEFKNK